MCQFALFGYREKLMDNYCGIGCEDSFLLRQASKNLDGLLKEKGIIVQFSRGE